MHEILISVVAFIVLIGLMVVVHEFGHFAVAKLCRVRVEAFSVGFGPRLFGIKIGETDYKICLLPLGGFVKMTGETPGEENVADDPAAFTSHPRWQRMLIGFAGPFSNFVLAFVLMFFYFAWFNEVPSVRPAAVEWVTPGAMADQAGLKAGDRFTQFGAVANPDLGAILETMNAKAGATVPATVDRAGVPVSLQLHLPAGDKAGDLLAAGFYPHYADKPLTIDQVVSGSAADEAGLRAGDTVDSIDGYAFHTLEPLLDYLQIGKGKPITLGVRGANGAQKTLVVHPRVQDGGWRLGITAQPYGDLPMRRSPIHVAQASARSYDYCVEGSLMIGQMLKKLVTHQASMKQLSGPVGIAVVAGKAAETKDWASKFGLASAISLNLGILNLLPFPILDGGMILFLLIESIIRQDISMAIKERIYQAAFVLIVVFFAFVIFNDVSKLTVFTHMRP
jgi:regulator of sigma E protease